MMNLDELEEDQRKRLERGTNSRNFRYLWNQAAHAPLDITDQVFGTHQFQPNRDIPAKCHICRKTFGEGDHNLSGQKFGEKDYIPNPMSERHAIPPAPQTDLVDPRITVIGPTRKDDVHLPAGCNATSGYYEMCERGTVGCTNHRRAANRFFRCYINHFDHMCRCSQPVIVDWQMLENAENAAMYVINILKGNAKSAKLSAEDVQYLSVSVTVIMAHWARKALGHKPEDEVDAAPTVPVTDQGQASNS